MTMNTLAMSFRFLFRFPEEPGLLPDPGSPEQSVLWAIVAVVLLCVLYVRGRGMVLNRLPRALSRSLSAWW